MRSYSRWTASNTLVDDIARESLDVSIVAREENYRIFFGSRVLQRRFLKNDKWPCKDEEINIKLSFRRQCHTRLFQTGVSWFRVPCRILDESSSSRSCICIIVVLVCCCNKHNVRPATKRSVERKIWRKKKKETKRVALCYQSLFIWFLGSALVWRWQPAIGTERETTTTTIHQRAISSGCVLWTWNDYFTKRGRILLSLCVCSKNVCDVHEVIRGGGGGWGGGGGGGGSSRVRMRGSANER